MAQKSCTFKIIDMFLSQKEGNRESLYTENNQIYRFKLRKVIYYLNIYPSFGTENILLILIHIVH